MLKQDIPGLIAALRAHYEKVKALAAFLELKQSELRPGDEISFFGFLDAQHEFELETSVLSGHAAMIQDTIVEKKLRVDPQNKRLLAEITTYASRVLFQAHF